MTSTIMMGMLLTNNAVFDENTLNTFLGYPTPGNALMYSIIVLYAEILGISVSILLAIICLIDFSLGSFEADRVYSASMTRKPRGMNKRMESFLDIFFFIFPTLTILYILVPTLGHLYNTDFSMNNVNGLFTIDVIGRQWYWTYVYHYDIIGTTAINNALIVNSNEVLSFDSIMVDSKTNRLLAVDNALIVPVDVPVTLSITAFDVIHSFALPQLGLKVDAIPGRVAQALLVVNYAGTYYGQCSELCGVYHGFMPIVLEAVKLESFYDWYTLHMGINISGLYMRSMLLQDAQTLLFLGESK